MSISKEGKCLVCGSERIDQSCIYYWSDDDNGGADYKKDIRYCVDCFDRSSAEQQHEYERAAHRAWARLQYQKLASELLEEKANDERNKSSN